MVQNPPSNAGNTGDVVRSLGPEDPLEKEMATRSYIRDLGRSHGQRSLVGYSCSCKESDMTEHTHAHMQVLFLSLSLLHTHTHTPTCTHIQMYLFSFFSLIKPSSILKTDTNRTLPAKYCHIFPKTSFRPSDEREPSPNTPLK